MNLILEPIDIDTLATREQRDPVLAEGLRAAAERLNRWIIAATREGLVVACDVRVVDRIVGRPDGMEHVVVAASRPL